mgnify:FL=1
MVVYSFPYVSGRTFTLDYLVAMRDSVLGEHIQGAFPGSYMTTKAFYPLLRGNLEERGILWSRARLMGDGRRHDGRPVCQPCPSR